MDSFFNKERFIECTVNVNIYYQRYRERMEIDVIGETEVESNFGNAIVSTLQFRDWLENRGDKDDEVSRRMWKAVEAKAREIGMEKTKRGKEMRGKRTK